jgi:hypothetical protein
MLGINAQASKKQAMTPKERVDDRCFVLLYSQSQHASSQSYDDDDVMLLMQTRMQGAKNELLSFADLRPKYVYTQIRSLCSIYPKAIFYT